MDRSIARITLPLIMFGWSLRAESQVPAAPSTQVPATDIPGFPDKDAEQRALSCACACLDAMDLYGFAVCQAEIQGIELSQSREALLLAAAQKALQQIERTPDAAPVLLVVAKQNLTRFLSTVGQQHRVLSLGPSFRPPAKDAFVEAQSKLCPIWPIC
jgi:hypothetical protein